MPTFLPGSTHTLKIELKLPDDYEEDEADLVLSMWLVNSKGKKVFVDYNYLKQVDRLITPIHLTRTFQEFSYSLVMPKRPGQYQLKMNVPDNMFKPDAKANLDITIKK
jgi:glycerophosphoryl diester phosphodiesterase